MIEDDTQNSRHAASAAFHNAPRLTKIAQAGMQGGPTGAAAEAAVFDGLIAVPDEAVTR